MVDDENEFESLDTQPVMDDAEAENQEEDSAAVDGDMEAEEIEGVGTDDAAVETEPAADDIKTDLTETEPIVVATEASGSRKTGRRLWSITAIVISSVVLLLAVAAIVGIWAGRSAAIDLVTGILDGVEEVAGIGRGRVAEVDDYVGEVRTSVGEVETAVDQISANVSDRGLVLTLLPPEREQELQRIAGQIGAAIESIRSVLQAVTELVEAVDNLPFVSLPRPEPAEVQQLQNDLESIRTDVNQLAADIQAFRDGVASEIATVSAAAGRVNSRLGATEQNLAAVDGKLARLQERTNELEDQFRLWVTVVAVVDTLLLIWVAYAMIVLIRGYWSQLQQ
jgi:methyl-accepting chemotaxis protein